jgi:hypothetical protein
LSLRAKRSSPAAFFAVASEAKQSEIASPDEKARLAMTKERAKRRARNDLPEGRDCFGNDDLAVTLFAGHSEPQSGEESLRLLRKRKDELAMTT